MILINKRFKITFHQFDQIECVPAQISVSA